MNADWHINGSIENGEIEYCPFCGRGIYDDAKYSDNTVVCDECGRRFAIVETTYYGEPLLDD